MLSDIVVKSRQNRSDKPEHHYHLSPKPRTAEEEDFDLGEFSSDDSGKLGAAFATKLKLDDPKTVAL